MMVCWGKSTQVKNDDYMSIDLFPFSVRFIIFLFVVSVSVSFSLSLASSHYFSLALSLVCVYVVISIVCHVGNICVPFRRDSCTDTGDTWPFDICNIFRNRKTVSIKTVCTMRKYCAFCSFVQFKSANRNNSNENGQCSGEIWTISGDRMHLPTNSYSKFPLRAFKDQIICFLYVVASVLLSIRMTFSELWHPHTHTHIRSHAGHTCRFT